jgi:hypothetical protein
MFGFRPDGRRLKDVDPLVQITPYLMPMRCDAQVFLEYKLDYEKAARYIAEKARQGEKITFMQIIAAAYVRSVSQLPELNRYIFNKQYYARNNCSLSYVVLKDPQDNTSNEVTVRIEFDLTDTIFDVRDRMVAAQDDVRNSKDDAFVTKLAGFLLKIPGLATFAVGAYRLLDRYGLAPNFLIRTLPFYSGLFITNNASIGLNHVWHHIYNFGNVGMFIGMGNVMREAIAENDGKARMKRWLPLGMTADERMCSGAHYAAFFASMVKYMGDPALLETPPEEVKFDFGGKYEYHVPKVGGR